MGMVHPAFLGNAEEFKKTTLHFAHATLASLDQDTFDGLPESFVQDAKVAELVKFCSDEKRAKTLWRGLKRQVCSIYYV